MTIQVVHSDAEGRMALADTLALAARNKPDLIIDFATLTGACVAALTERYSGVFTNRSEWHATLELRRTRAAASACGRFRWTRISTPILEIAARGRFCNARCDGKGDHILAARFLKRFVPDQIPWVHIDLASSNRSGGLAHVPTDFTGFGVRYATQLLLDQPLLGRSVRTQDQASARRLEPYGRSARRSLLLPAVCR